MNAYQIEEAVSRLADREEAKITPWANVFPHVHGGLFSQGAPTSPSAREWQDKENAGNDEPLSSRYQADGDVGVPGVPRSSRSALLHGGNHAPAKKAAGRRNA